jgi:hypothetical protein
MSCCCGTGLGHQAVAGRMPVVYVTVPPATPKMLASEFARFAGVPVHRGQNQADITNAVCDVLARLRVDLVLAEMRSTT